MGSDRCAQCRAGRYSETSGVAVCTQCGMGYFSGKVAATSFSFCKQCEPGFYNDVGAAKECKKCPYGSSHDQYASKAKSDCISCPFCGTRYGGGNAGTCPVPKSGRTCTNCPPGIAKTSGTEWNCGYCPTGEFPDLDSAECMSFKTGDFDAVPDVNARECYNRASYASFHRPLVGDGGWGHADRARPKDNPSQRFDSQTNSELEACSSLHMMGALMALPELVNRGQGNGACSRDESLRELCEWSKYILNLDIEQRESKKQAEEAAEEHAKRLDRCERTCTSQRCQETCRAITEEEKNAEKSFDVLPFEVEKCEINGLSCVTTCTSTRPVKTRTSSWNCWNVIVDGPVQPKLIEPRTILPRCEANCDGCPQGTWRHASYEKCDAGAQKAVSRGFKTICSRHNALIVSMIMSVLVQS